jgi:hypothetical protein
LQIDTSSRPHPLLLVVADPQGGRMQEFVLPRQEWEYVVSQVGTLWQVRLVGTEEAIYSGPGPVVIRGPPAPF